MPVIDDDGNVGYFPWDDGEVIWHWMGIDRSLFMRYPFTDQDHDELKKRFTYHSPKDDQPERYVKLRNQAREMAEQIMLNTPRSREQSLALTHLEEAIFWANAAIARNE